MKRWEENLKRKVHTAIVLNAKPTITVKHNHPLRSPKTDRLFTQNDQLQTYLKSFNLQQYLRVIFTQKLTTEGFNDNPEKLGILSDMQIQDLLLRLKVLPGHSSRFWDMIRLIRQVNNIQTIQSRSKSAAPVNFQSPPYVPDKRRLTQQQINARPKNYQKILTELEQAKHRIQQLESQIQTNIMPVTPKGNNRYKNKWAAFEESKIHQEDRGEVGKSLDSYKMRSTLTNPDIEELSHCISKVIFHHMQKNEQNVPPLGIISEFERHFIDINSTRVPSQQEIYNFIRNVFITSKMEKEVLVLMLVYLEKVLQKSGLRMRQQTWKRMVFTAMILGSKIWDDESFESKHFANVFTQFTLKEINDMEGAYLNLLDFRLKISSQEYAKAYFLMRTYAESKNRSCTLRPLDVATVLKLQNAAPRAEEEFKKIHADSLYKTL